MEALPETCNLVVGLDVPIPTLPVLAMVSNLVLLGPKILNDSEAVPMPPTWMENLD